MCTQNFDSAKFSLMEFILIYPQSAINTYFITSSPIQHIYQCFQSLPIRGEKWYPTVVSVCISLTREAKQL